MQPNTHVFISYSTKDREVAKLLYNDLTNSGANVFQFEASATPGQPAWKEVLTKIENSDIFILLASKSSVLSRPVLEEVKCAHYQHVNSDKPSILLSLILERGVKLPIEIRANNHISFINYKKGITGLIKFLNLQKPTSAPSASSSLLTRKVVLILLLIVFSIVGAVYLFYHKNSNTTTSRADSDTTKPQNIKPIEDTLERYDSSGSKEYKLGESYYAKNNYDSAFYWFDLSSRKNNEKAMCMIGNLYFKGNRHIKQDYEEAFQWYQKSATLNNTVALYSLGIYYLKGHNVVKKDTSKALQYFRHVITNDDNETAVKWAQDAIDLINNKK